MSKQTRASVDKLQTVWSALSTADRFALLGHASEELSADDRKTLASIAVKSRKREY